MKMYLNLGVSKMKEDDMKIKSIRDEIYVWCRFRHLTKRFVEIDWTRAIAYSKARHDARRII